MSEKLLTDFMQMGCKSRKEAAVTLQVYLELSEVKKCWDLQYNYNRYLECLYITGRKSKNSENITFVPVAATDDLSFDIMQKYLALSTEDNKSVCLAICSPDSTCIFYNISEGLVTPSTTSRVKEKRTSGIIDGLLKKNRKLLEDGAMYNLPVTIAANRDSSHDENEDCSE